jgi:hypothetical protein
VAEEIDAEPLIRVSAQGAGVSAQLLEQLLALESAFPHSTIYGSKTDFARRVTAILDDARGEGAGA